MHTPTDPLHCHPLVTVHLGAAIGAIGASVAAGLFALAPGRPLGHLLRQRGPGL